MSLKIEQGLKQNLSLNQNLITTLNILTLPTYELEEFITKESEENPFLKVSLPSNNRETTRVSAYSEGLSDAHLMTLNNFCSSGETLFSHLKEQLGLLKLSRDEKEMALLIISSLNEKGLLNSTKDELLENTNVENKEKLFDKMQNLVMHLEPLGSASFTVWDALSVQLDEKYKRKEITKDEYNNALKFLTPESFEYLSDEKSYTSALQAKIENAKKIIKTLSPYPSYGYKTESETGYVIPELFFKENEDKSISVSTDNDNLPTLVIDNEYMDILNETKDAETKKYLKENYTNAIKLISTLNERNTTLLLIGNALLERQYDFFTKGKDYISPLTLEDISADIKRDKSTISKIINTKYMDTPYGIFPIKILFSRSISSPKNRVTSDSENISRDRAKVVLKKLIDENSDKKLSDEKLKLLLEKEGINISRRTVNKYRNELF